MARTERPLDPGDSPLLRLAADLRKLREQAGSPPYRELARRAHYSATVLSEAAGGRKLPSLAVTMAYVRACGADPAEWEQRWREVAADLQVASTSDSAESEQVQAPYVGLAAFGPEDARWYFGRDGLTEELCAKVAQRRFVAVVGASGSGKSSLLRAGLLHQVRSRGLHGVLGGPTVLMTPGPRPLEECAAQLAALANGSAVNLDAAVRADPRSLHLTALKVLADQPAELELLLVVDQFEELFTLCHDPDERTRFLDVLQTAAAAGDSRIRIVIGIRADFYAHCTHYPDLAQVLVRNQVLVEPMTTEQLRLAITQPAIQADCQVETALVSQVIADATGHPGVLPMVSHALRETWRRRRGNALSLTGYLEAGGITQAVARTAEATYTALTGEQQEWARQLFLRLVALGEGTEDTKRRLDRGELDLDRPDASAVLEQLARARLVTVDQDGIAIVHEALIGNWPRLRGWLNQDREGLRTHRQLTETASVWEALDRDPGALYRGTQLAIAREWDARRHTSLTASERQFLNTSVRAEVRRHRLRKVLVAVAVLLVVLAVAASVVAVQQREAAVEVRRLALSRGMAAKSMAVAATQPEAALLLAVEAFQQAPTVEARSALLTAQTSPFKSRISSETVGGLFGVALSKDGRLMATSSTEAAVRLWDVASGRETRVLPTAAADSSYGVAFRPDGKVLAIASNRGGIKATVRLWDVAGDREAGPLLTVDGTIYGVAFSPDGKVLATSGNGGAVRLWDVASGRETGALHTPAAAALGVAFSSDGQTLASGGSDGITTLWDVASRRPTATVGGHAGAVYGVAFSPDGRTLAAANTDATATLWDVASRRPTATVGGHAGAILGVAFSPDGQTLATASEDRTVALWDTSGSSVISPLIPRTYSVAVSPDGRVAAIRDDNGTVRLWDIVGRREISTLAGGPGTVARVDFSQDGRTLAASYTGGSVRLWDVSTGRETATLPDAGHSADVVLSPDGKTLATGDIDRVVRLWDIASRRTVATFDTGTSSLSAMAFSPDGKLLATTADSREVRLWDIATRQESTGLSSITGTLRAVVFSPDGKTLATGDSSGTATLWDVASRQEITRLTGTTGSVELVVFSPDGKTLATGGSNGTATLWDVASRQETAVLTGHTGVVDEVAFSSDGQTLTTVGNDVALRRWDLRVDHVTNRLCQLIKGTISREQWETLIPDVPFQPSCR